MKKTFCIFLAFFLCCSLLTACVLGKAEESPIRIGMTIEEFYEIVPEESCYWSIDYAFYEDSEGNPCAAEFSAEGGYNTVTAYYTYSKEAIDTSAAAFDSLTEGMPLLEVVEKVGIPIGSATSGMFTLVFPGDEGYYIIYFSYEDNTLMWLRDPIDHDPSIE